MNRAVWILLSISVIYFLFALMLVKNPVAKRNYLLVASIFVVVSVVITIINHLTSR